MVAEQGTRVEGKWVEASKDETMQENVIYEMQFKVDRINLPEWGWIQWLDAIQDKITAALIRKYYEYKGLEVIWWRLTDEKFNIQVRQKTSAKSEASIGWVGFAVSAIITGTIAVMSALFVWLTFEWVKKLMPPPEPIPWPTGLAVVLGGIFILGYIMKPKVKEA